ncbi:hypothetical protein CCUS01_05944 [Colletotrichum cuscutae]|uniref:Uncharacterized protein n=1 Tax=Colletotrichum cuscutae TaxID=1209917 RepID=A0AAI9V7S4_9PEZI|nr:hypothetical protein CCUS01_05944 [Colletotrichum cuscutae]
MENGNDALRAEPQSTNMLRQFPTQNIAMLYHEQTNCGPRQPAFQDHSLTLTPRCDERKPQIAIPLQMPSRIYQMTTAALSLMPDISTQATYEFIEVNPVVISGT